MRGEFSIMLDVKSDIGELLGELFSQARGQREAGFEVGIEHDRVCAAARCGQRGAGSCSNRQGQRGNAKGVAGLFSHGYLLQGVNAVVVSVC
jgi:hypothetical protein